MKYRAFLHSDPDNFQYELKYYHNPKRWYANELESDNPIKNISNWSEEIKYLNDNNDTCSAEIKNLPTDTGGIYVFYLKGINISFIENYILYIGRCQYTVKQNIRKRAMEYLTDNRIMIQEMFRRWKQHLYYRYFPNNNNNETCRDEILLIKAIFPEYNEEIPDKIIKVRKEPAFKSIL